MLSAAHIKSLSLGFNVENAFLITNYSGSDPEVTSYDAVFEQGVDSVSYTHLDVYKRQCTAEGQGETEADDIRQAIRRALTSLFPEK